jgi:hypothetical protein
MISLISTISSSKFTLVELKKQIQEIHEKNQALETEIGAISYKNETNDRFY